MARHKPPKIDPKQIRRGHFLLTIKEIESFLKMFHKTETCWIWNHKTIGYPIVKCRGNNIGGHTLSYLLHHGSIPESLNVLHSCDNRHCVNPDHLFLGTPEDNSRDRNAKGRTAKPYTNGEKSKITENDVIEIRACAALGATQRQLAKRFNTNNSNINYIVKRKTWKYVK